ncbi:unnamed protein product [Pseudo-nitzschia multistriata]|uniref:t-SNARE coiled-coil homology domain-containing protein n=1 Tax=Pseudo-nitzschia multistriata TaxID=183589 RepID=A0A448ZEM4_9STRA|nr:unnamed protein product [Pseudo-nitzschia multistriata]
MSFSDLGRQAISAFSSPPPAAIRGSSRRRKSEGSDVGRFDKHKHHKPPTASRRQSDGGAVVVSRQRDWKTSRGVRPRLDHLQCPVTQKNLLGHDQGNDASLASTSISATSTATHDDDDDEYYSSNETESASSIDRHRRTMARDSERERSSRRLPNHYRHGSGEKTSLSSGAKQPRQSSSSSLSTEIARFQKMVADLESASRAPAVASSPEAMWKSRILLRSARDAEADLERKLLGDKAQQNHRPGQQQALPQTVVAARNNKLARDFRRASQQFRSVLQAMELQQRAEVSVLTSSAAAAAGDPDGTSTGPTAKAQKLEEDFFDRAMRERNEEVQKISTSMRKVNEIYQDLAGLVDGQQEQIDKLEDLNEEVKADTRAGLEEIQHGMWKLCAADHTSVFNSSSSNNKDNGRHHSLIDLSDDAPLEEGPPPPLDPSDLLTCMMCHHHGGTTTASSPSQHGKSRSFDPGASSSSVWKASLQLPSNFESVQESAQDAYQRGHAMVGGIVEQVHEVVANSNLPSSPVALQLREVRNRMYCTPQPQDYNNDYYCDDDDNDDGIEDGDGKGHEANRDWTTSDDGPDENNIGKHYFQIEETSNSPSRRRSGNPVRDEDYPRHDQQQQKQHRHGRHSKTRHSKSSKQVSPEFHKSNQYDDYGQERQRRDRRKTSSRSSPRVR